MIVYGDLVRVAVPRPALAAVAGALSGPTPPGGLADVFVDAAAVAQGLLDAEFEARGGVDARSPLADALMAALTGLARTLLAEAPADPAPWRALAGSAPSAPVATRLAEGYAFYALHPLAYARAVRAAGLGPDTRVIGLRSIGVGLAAVAAAAAGAPPPVTVRPVDHPFARRLRLAADLMAELAAAPGRVAVADEGPGLSGSSFAAAAAALARLGVGRDRLVLLPSHDGEPGAQASADSRTLWREAAVSAAPPVALDTLGALASDLLGAPTAPVRDLSGGLWRGLVYTAGAGWPAVDTAKERRKALVETERGRFLFKWAGLGAEGREKLARARLLAQAGLGPPALDLREGWIVSPWLAGRPLGAGDPAPRAALARGLRLRASHFPEPPEAGVSAAGLAEMARVNAGEALGARAGAAAEAAVAALARDAPPRVSVDGRLHRHEWLALPDGRRLKTDAVDHARAHDLIGAQEIGWDVAGAAAEWKLADADALALARTVEAPPGRLPALKIAYLAFQLGAASMAADAHGGDERTRLAALRDAYTASLARALADD